MTIESRPEHDVAEKVLSASFTLLGILVGVFGIVIGQLITAGPWKDARAEIVPIAAFLAALMIFDCIVCVLALINVADYYRSPRLLVGAVCTMLVAIAAFVVGWTIQLL